MLCVVGIFGFIAQPRIDEITGWELQSVSEDCGRSAYLLRASPGGRLFAVYGERHVQCGQKIEKALILYFLTFCSTIRCRNICSYCRIEARNPLRRGR